MGRSYGDRGIAVMGRKVKKRILEEEKEEFDTSTSSDSESEEFEDEDGALVTPEVDAQGFWK